VQSPEIGNALTAFLTIFPAELPDKTMIATLVLTSRFGKPLTVWIGVASAFVLHVIVAVGAGTLLGRLPKDVVSVATALLFSVGAVLLWRDATSPREADMGDLPTSGSGMTNRKIMATAFVTIVVAEWGDLTQLAMAGLAAKRNDPIAVGVGSLLALWAVAGIAAVAGRTLLRVAPLHLVQRIAAVLFGCLAIWTIIELLR
jgi:Ca2+/H+ antiporter, TMEM165/GDT1 family